MSHYNYKYNINRLRIIYSYSAYINVFRVPCPLAAVFFIECEHRST